MSEFKKEIQNLIQANKDNPEGNRIRYKRIHFRSHLECDWYKVFTEDLFRTQKVFYEPVILYRNYDDKRGDREVKYESYKPDFAIMPKGWKRPSSIIDFSREVLRFGTFIETKPDTGDNIVTNRIHLCESHVVMIYGYPHQNPNAFVVKTFGHGEREGWETIRMGGDIKGAVEMAAVDNNLQDTRFLRMTKFKFYKKKDGLRT